MLAVLEPTIPQLPGYLLSDPSYLHLPSVGYLGLIELDFAVVRVVLRLQITRGQRCNPLWRSARQYRQGDTDVSHGNISGAYVYFN